MDTNAFLASLPALLAIVGFVIYRLLIYRKEGSRVVTTIVERLRNAPGPTGKGLEKLDKLGPRQILLAVKEDLELKRLLSEQDIKLLTQIELHEHKESMFVHGLVGAIFLFGVWQFVASTRNASILKLTAMHIASDHPDAKGLAVDLDNLVLTWTASGIPEDVEVFLENPQSLKRSTTLRTNSAEQRLVFPRSDYQECLSSRERSGHSRIRAIAKSKETTFTSPEAQLLVGIKIAVYAFEQEREILVSALIDNRSIDNYVFDAKLIVWKKRKKAGQELEILSFDGPMKNPKTTFPVEDFADVSWDTMNLAYFGPDDGRQVRIEINRP